MSKEWISISCNTTKGRVNHSINKDRKNNNILRNLKSKNFKDLKQEGKDLYTERKANEDFLLAGYKNNILKSNTLKKQAENIIEDRKKISENKKKNKSN